MTVRTAVDFWEDHYASGAFSAEPHANERLVDIAADLPPGEALDLGSGNGGDAIWLARQGWAVAAVDISATAIARLNSRARSLGLGKKIVASQLDLQESFPAGTFELVNVHYLHTPFGLDKARLLRAAARALEPGGHLLVVDHGSTAPWSWNQDPGLTFPHPIEILADLDLDPAVWVADKAQALARVATGPSGETATVTDHVLFIRRACV